MQIKFKSFRNQLLASFLAVNLVFISAIILVLLINLENRRFQEYNNLFTQLELNFQNLIIQQQAYFIEDKKNDEYFEFGSSDFLNARQETSFKIKEIVELIEQNSLTESQHISLKVLKNTMHKHDSLFEIAEHLIHKRGFKDFGERGKMRKIIHQLENDESSKISLIHILQLRRHEKDFLLRETANYANDHDNLCNSILYQLKIKNSLENARSIKLLTEYQNSFKNIVDLTSKIGSYDKSGVLNELHLEKKVFLNAVKDLLTSSFQKNQSRLSVLKVLLYLSLVFSLFFGLLFAYRFSQKRAQPINELVKRVNDVPTLGDKAFERGIENSSIELHELFESFKNVFYKLRTQMQLTKKSANAIEEKNVELQRVNRELDQFVYSISHDLRAPLTSVMGLVELLRLEEDQNRKENLYNMMVKSLKRLDSFIHDILDYSRNSRLEIKNDQINLEEVVHDILDSLEFTNKEIDFKYDIAIEGEYSICTDQRRVKVILNNLISNAVKYLDPNKENRKIQIKAKIGKSEFEISVIDNGIGIDEKHIDKVFNMFYRATEISKGSGLGLYIVGETVKVMNGQIKLNSIKEMGTTVTIQLPNNC
jgi:signal transduction histidine kinase